MFYNTTKTYEICQKRDVSGFIPACQRVLVTQWLEHPIQNSQVSSTGLSPQQIIAFAKDFGWLLIMIDDQHTTDTNYSLITILGQQG